MQVVGLQHWVTLVPGISDDALDPACRASAEDRFGLWHNLLGKAIGETLGYALTATFTVLVVIALRHNVLPGWLAILGYASAALIATGVVIPIFEPHQLHRLRCLVRLAALRCCGAVPGTRIHENDAASANAAALTSRA